MQRVGENARAIDGASSEILSAADDLSRRTEQQAASVEEQSVSLHGINQAIAEIDKGTQQNVVTVEESTAARRTAEPPWRNR